MMILIKKKNVSSRKINKMKNKYRNKRMRIRNKVQNKRNNKIKIYQLQKYRNYRIKKY